MSQQPKQYEKVRTNDISLEGFLGHFLFYRIVSRVLLLLTIFQQAPMGQTERAEGTSRTFYQNAEKEGVEPSIDFRLYTLSRRTH